MKFLLFIGLILIMSCRSGEQSALDNLPNNAAHLDQILFLNLNFRHDSLTDSTSVELIDFKIVEGKLKSDFASKNIIEPTDLRIAFYDISAKLLKTIIFENPLIQNAEYFAENGEISRSIVKLPQTEFSLRTQLPVAYSFITISVAGESEQIDDSYLLKFNLGGENEINR